MSVSAELTRQPLNAEERERMRRAVEEANVPTLLLVLVQLTGDERWITDPYRISRVQGLDDIDSGGLTPQLQSEVRTAALDAIVAWRAGTPRALADPDPELVVRMVSMSVGDTIPTEYAQMYAERLRSATRGAEGIAEPSSALDLDVLIIGAGLSGLGAAVKLREAGASCTIVDQFKDVGGVWLSNSYPGAGVDTPSHLYSFSFLHEDWQQYFSVRTHVLDYARKIVERFGLRSDLQLETRVIRSDFDERSQSWLTRVRRGDGTEETLRSNIVISAVGAFGRPSWPDIPGLDDFPGAVVHSAEYPEAGLDLRGKRVAVVGNGASAVQLVPAIADEVEALYIFQRSRQWVAPFSKWRTKISDDLQFLLREVPLYEAWYRLRLSWIFDSRTHASLQRDPEWPHPERAVNRLNDAYRMYFDEYMRSQLVGHEPLADQVIPEYPPFGKRMLLDNGWLPALRRDNVHLVSRAAEAVRGASVVSGDAEYPVDIIILATGFEVTRFLSSMIIHGRDGRALHEEWSEDDARAYLGMTVPGFPNFFTLCGPNTQLGHGGSLLTMIEAQVNYIVQALTHMSGERLRSIEVKRDVYENYNKRVDVAHANMVWTHPGVNNYYRNARGRVVVTNPFRAVDFWNATRQVDLADYDMVAGEDSR